VSVLVLDLSDNSTFGENVLEGTDSFDLGNTTNGVLTVASSFTQSTKSRRSLSTKGGYDIQDKVAFVTFSIDAATTTGNVVELWMYATESKFLVSTLTITPTSTSMTVSGMINEGSNVQSQTNACAFSKSVVYQLKLSLSQDTNWVLKGELLLGRTTICTVSLMVQNLVARSFFSDTFTYVLSQSATGTTVRKIQAEEVVSIKINQMGVECSKGTCSSSAPTATKAPKTTLTTKAPIEIIAGVIAVFGGLVFVVILVIVVVIAVVIKRRKKRAVAIYAPRPEEEEEQPDDVPEPIAVITTYDAFTQSKNEDQN
jgi:hypothetical protein